MKYKFVGKEEVEYGMLGVVKPGQEFEVNNEEFLPIFKGNPLFKEVKKVNKVKKEEGE